MIDKPEVTLSVPNPYIVIEGQTATLECTVVDANPNTSITWEWFRTKSPRNIIYTESSYVIPNIQRSMSGFYSCIANNSVGTSLAATTVVDVQCELCIKFCIHDFESCAGISPSNDKLYSS